MSGHSKWSKVKHKKALKDPKRGKIFSKMSKIITITAKEKGGDPNTNPALRMAIEKAKSVNMPKENIERAIKRGTGELKGATLEEFTYEAYGPAGVAMIIEGITDNKNRTLSEIKHILNTCGGKLAETGSLDWLFEKKGSLEILNIKNQIPNLSNFELKIIEAGAEDIKQNNEAITIYTKPENLSRIKNIIENENIQIDSYIIDWVPKNEVQVTDEDKKRLKELFNALNEQDEVEEIFSNLANNH